MRHHFPPPPPPRIPTYFPPPPPYRPPPPPPPPPVPVDALPDDSSPGPPRCYFCGKRFPEAEVRKTEYAVGHGQTILVLICPACRQQKARGEGPFAKSQFAPLLACLPAVFFAAIVLFIVFGFVLPNIREHEQRREQMRKEHDEFRKRNGFAP